MVKAWALGGVHDLQVEGKVEPGDSEHQSVGIDFGK